ALVFSMMSFDPASAASVLSAPVRCPVCSGVTSVSDVQSARLALTATGASRLVTVVRNASASFSLADLWAAARAGEPGTTAASTTPAQATRRSVQRIEARMRQPYLKVSAIDSQV